MSATQHILTVEDYAVLIDSGKDLAAEINLDDLLSEILLKASQLTASADGSIAPARLGKRSKPACTTAGQ